MANRGLQALTLGLFLTCTSTAVAKDGLVRTYVGACDASAAVALSNDQFVAATDDDNTLRVYSLTGSNQPTALALGGLPGSTDETDIEGAAIVDDLVYWIASHGQTKKAKDAPARNRLFATRIVNTGGKVTLKPEGAAYTDLRGLLFKEPTLGTALAAASKKAPEDGGLNVEGLAAGPDGALLIGLRSPVAKDGAIIVPLIVKDGWAKARLGQPLKLQLGKDVGIRSLERVGSGYLIIAGPAGPAGPFALFRWAGPGTSKVERLRSLPLHPEALFVTPNGQLQLLSDDGDDNGCKDASPEKRSFRGMTIDATSGP